MLNSFNTDKYKLTKEENDNIYMNNSQNIKNKIMLTDKEKLSPEKDKFNNLSTQINMNKLNIFNNNNINNLESNDFHSKTFPSSLNNNNTNNINYNNELTDTLDDKNNTLNSQAFKNKEKNIISYPNLYTLKEDKIINFNLTEKKFVLINPVDNTDGLYGNYITKYSYPPLTLNTPLGFFILINDFIFYYDEINNTINILTKLICPHINSNFIFINEELYSISGKNCLTCG